MATSMAAGLAIGMGSGLAIGIGSGRAAGKKAGETEAFARIERNLRELARGRDLKIYADDREMTWEEFTAAVMARGQG